MIDHDQFVARYQDAWKRRDNSAFEALWDPEGVLIHPTAAGPLQGREALRTFENRTRDLVPDLSWRLDSWAARGEHLFVEWTCSATVGGKQLTWSGVDRFVLRGGRIVEEVVYCDTQRLWAALDPASMRPALVSLG